jgi:hypothetical protein
MKSEVQVLPGPPNGLRPAKTLVNLGSGPEGARPALTNGSAGQHHVESRFAVPVYRMDTS